MNLHSSSIIRLFFLMKLFYETSLASDIVGKFIIACLVDPIMLTHMATHKQHQAKERSSRRVQMRPGTPVFRVKDQGKMIHETMSEGEDSSIDRDIDHSVDHSDPTLFDPTLFDPTRVSPSKSQKSAISAFNNDFYDELEMNILTSNSEAVSCLILRPELNQLGIDKLMELLEMAFSIYKNSLNSSNLKKKHRKKDILIDLFAKITEEVPSSQLTNILFFSLKRSIPDSIFALAIENVNFLSREDLDLFIREIERIYIWETIEKVGKVRIDEFALKINEISINLKDSKRLTESEQVKEVISIDRTELRSSLSRTFCKVQFVYMTINLLDSLRKSSTAEIPSAYFEDCLNRLFRIGKTEMSLGIDEILGLIEFNFRVFLPEIKEIEPIEKVLKSLHQIIRNHPDLRFIPVRMVGIEDLFFYVEGNLKSMAFARMKYYRSSKITKGQLMNLLNTADLADSQSSNLIILILGMFNINQQNVPEPELDLLNHRPRILMRGLFTFPPRFEGENICTMNEELKETEIIQWNVPEDLFIPSEINLRNEIYLQADSLLNLPRLFLHRVFGLPLSNFAEVMNGMDELPERQELMDVANFFLEKRCSIDQPGSFPLVKIVCIK